MASRYPLRLPTGFRHILLRGHLNECSRICAPAEIRAFALEQRSCPLWAISGRFTAQSACPPLRPKRHRATPTTLTADSRHWGRLDWRKIDFAQKTARRFGYLKKAPKLEFLRRHVHATKRWSMYRHILIPTDGSDLAEHAVTTGLSLAKSIRAEVTVIIVEEPFDWFSVSETKAKRALEELARHTEYLNEHPAGGLDPAANHT